MPHLLAASPSPPWFKGRLANHCCAVHKLGPSSTMQVVDLKNPHSNSGLLCTSLHLRSLRSSWKGSATHFYLNNKTVPLTKHFDDSRLLMVQVERGFQQIHFGIDSLSIVPSPPSYATAPATKLNRALPKKHKQAATATLPTVSHRGLRRRRYRFTSPLFPLRVYQLVSNVVSSHSRSLYCRTTRL